MFRRLSAVIAAISLVGCASSPLKVPVDNLAQSEKTTVEDLRPATEANKEVFSLMITSERFGYMRLPQDFTDPSGPRLFAHHVQQKYAAGTMPPVKLHHFVVYSNTRAEQRRGATGAALGGMIGALIAQSTTKHEGDPVNVLADPARFARESGESEYKRALYAEPQIPADTSVYIVYIESESDQKRHFTRTVWPIKPVKKGDARMALYDAMDAAIRFNLAQQ